MPANQHPLSRPSPEPGWEILTEFRLIGQADRNFSAWPPVAAALQPFHLPIVDQKQLELALAEAVLDAYVCEAQILCIRLFVSSQSRAKPPEASAYSWGFFLIHTQSPEPCYQIELFIYREAQRKEPDGGA